MLKEKFTENKTYSQFFSFELLSYYDSITTNENYEWIIKYFNILMKNENINAEKFDMHHIRPCCTFKDEEHRTRKQTEKLANEFNGNIIKLSYKNHIMAHYFLWKMFPKDKKFRRAIYMMLGKLDFEYLTENEIIKFAEIQEECKKANMTKEEKKQHQIEWRKNNKDQLLKKSKERYENNKKEILKRKKKYRDNNKEKISKVNKKWKDNNKEKIKEYNKEYRKENKDEIKEYNKHYNENHKEKRKEYDKQRYEDNKNKILERNKSHQSQKCIDPIIHKECTYSALQHRKSRNKEKYKDIILKDCIIQSQS